MFGANNGKLLIYASSSAPKRSRLEPVSSAAEKMAKQLRMNLEIKTFRKRFTQIYVYYKGDGDEPIPIYCSKGETSNSDEVYSVLKNMMFVLSFHPKQVALRHVRERIKRFS